MRNTLENIGKVSHGKTIIKLPSWYLKAYNIKLMRLYGKKTFLKSFIVSIFENIYDSVKYSNFRVIIIIIDTLFYLPLTTIKIIINKIKIENKR